MSIVIFTLTAANLLLYFAFASLNPPFAPALPGALAAILAGSAACTLGCLVSRKNPRFRFLFIPLPLLPLLLAPDILSLLHLVPAVVYPIVILAAGRFSVFYWDYRNHVLWSSCLLLLMLLTTMMWVSRETQTVTDNSMREIREFYEEQTRDGRVPDAAVVDAFLTERAERIESVDSRNTFFSYGLFIVAVLIMINNFRISRSREQEWEKELGVARRESSTDPLTGVKNKHAFFIWTERIDKQIENEDRAPFAIAVCDINDLKRINDNYGHKAGDDYIIEACKIICDI